MKQGIFFFFVIAELVVYQAYLREKLNFGQPLLFYSIFFLWAERTNDMVSFMYCIFGNIFIRVSKWFIESCLHSKHCPWKRINYKVIFRTFVQTSDRLIMCRYIVTKNLSYTAWYLHFFMYHVFWNCVKLDENFLI